MAQKCTICTHPDRESVDRSILEGESNRSIAKRFGINHSAVQRHRNQHIPQHLAQAKQAEVVTQADSLVDDLLFLKSKACDLLRQAETMEDFRAASALIGQARQVIETLAEVRGELQRNQIINIIHQPIWIETRAVILNALEPYPDARRAVSSALLKEIS